MINHNKKTLWMLAGGEMQIPTAYYAKKEGYNLIISDMNFIGHLAMTQKAMFYL